jgi:hypothetical protein
MEQIYKSIDEYVEEQEVKDYINDGIYPKRLQFNNKPIKIYKNIKKEFVPITNIEPQYEPIMNDSTDEELLLCEKKLLGKIIQLERTLKEKMISECHVCFEIMVNNYVSPSCGHHICIRCFTANIRQNSQNCEMCCLCRRNIVEI